MNYYDMYVMPYEKRNKKHLNVVFNKGAQLEDSINSINNNVLDFLNNTLLGSNHDTDYVYDVTASLSREAGIHGQLKEVLYFAYKAIDGSYERLHCLNTLYSAISCSEANFDKEYTASIDYILSTSPIKAVWCAETADDSRVAYLLCRQWKTLYQQIDDPAAWQVLHYEMKEFSSVGI